MKLENFMIINKKTKKRGLGEEDKMHKKFAAIINHLEMCNKVNPDCKFWTYDAGGEKRNAITGGLIRAKGHKRGKPDYLFKMLIDNIMYYYYLEFKTRDGVQKKEQKDFEKTCQLAINERYYLVRSVYEALEILVNKKVLLLTKNEIMQF